MRSASARTKSDRSKTHSNRSGDGPSAAAHAFAPDCLRLIRSWFWVFTAVNRPRGCRRINAPKPRNARHQVAPAPTHRVRFEAHHANSQYRFGRFALRPRASTQQRSQRQCRQNGKVLQIWGLHDGNTESQDGVSSVGTGEIPAVRPRTKTELPYRLKGFIGAHTLPHRPFGRPTVRA